MATMAALTEHDESGDDEHEDASEVHEVQSNKNQNFTVLVHQTAA